MEGLMDFVGTKDLKVYVKTHEVDDYIKVLGKQSVFEVPENLVGLGAIRRFLVDQHRDEDWFVILDDDTRGIMYRFDDKMIDITDGDHFRAILQNSEQIAEDLGTPIFTYDASLNPSLYTQMDIVSFSGNVPSCHGIIPRLLGDINYDSRLIVMNDYDIALQCKYYRRYLFIDKRYNLKWSNKWFNKGGLSTLRTRALLEKMNRILLQKYGPQVIKFAPKKVKCHINFPF